MRTLNSDSKIGLRKPPVRLARVLALACATMLVVSACSSNDTAKSESSASSTTAEKASIDEWMEKAKQSIPDAEFRKMCVTVKTAAELSVVVPSCSYLAAIVSHDGSKIMAAPGVWRLENGNNTAESADELKESMGNHWFRDYVEGMRDIRWFVAGDNAISYYVLNIKNVETIPSVLLNERFQVSDGLVTEIEAVFQYCSENITNSAPGEVTGATMCSKVTGA